MQFAANSAICPRHAHLAARRGPGRRDAGRTPTSPRQPPAITRPTPLQARPSRPRRPPAGASFRPPPTTPDHGRPDALAHRRHDRSTAGTGTSPAARSTPQPRWPDPARQARTQPAHPASVSSSPRLDPPPSGRPHSLAAPSAPAIASLPHLPPARLSYARKAPEDDRTECHVSRRTTSWPGVAAPSPGAPRAAGGRVSSLTPAP